jgi:hypothetical protein
VVQRAEDEELDARRMGGRRAREFVVVVVGTTMRAEMMFRMAWLNSGIKRVWVIGVVRRVEMGWVRVEV